MKKLRSTPAVFAFLASLLLSSFAVAQDAALPDAPDAATQQTPQQSAQQPADSHEDNQQKRIFGILPNFRAVTAGTTLPPQTVKGKFVTATQDSFDYSALLLAALVAVEQYGESDTPEFGTGGVGYSRYLWHSFTDQTVENYLVEFIVPAIAHEDTRYYSLGRGGFVKRAGYSLSRSFITKSDSGKTTFNAGEIVGAGLAAGVSNLYYPGPERTASNTLEKWGTSVGIDTIGFFVKEFAPDIYHAAFHKKTDKMYTPGGDL